MVERLIQELPGAAKITETKTQIRLRLRNPNRYTKFRTQDVGREGFSQRVAGWSKKTGWQTQAWLFNKEQFGRSRALAMARLQYKKRRK